MKPCDFCTTQHYEEFILRELMNCTASFESVL